MKQTNLVLLFSLAFIRVVTLSSWRLFGKDEPTDQEGAQSPTGQCYLTGFQDSYFFGFITKRDVPVTATVDCDTNEITGLWTTSPN